MDIGKWLYFGGLVLILAGMVISHYPGAIAWFGRLPGDLRFQSRGLSILVPLTSTIIVSVIIFVGAKLIEAYLYSGK